MYFGLQGEGQPIGRYDDMFAGWCSKVRGGRRGGGEGSWSQLVAEGLPALMAALMRKAMMHTIWQGAALPCHRVVGPLLGPFLTRPESLRLPPGGLRPPRPRRQDRPALHLPLQGLQPLHQPAQGVQGDLLAGEATPPGRAGRASAAGHSPSTATFQGCRRAPRAVSGSPSRSRANHMRLLLELDVINVRCRHAIIPPQKNHPGGDHPVLPEHHAEQGLHQRGGVLPGDQRQGELIKGVVLVERVAV